MQDHSMLIKCMRCTNSTNPHDCTDECKYYHRTPLDDPERMQFEKIEGRTFPDDFFDYCDSEKIFDDAADTIEANDNGIRKLIDDLVKSAQLRILGSSGMTEELVILRLKEILKQEGKQ